ncbi:gliding motility-associated ABC transporter substrate-binding protein GldG [Flammeovirgaceae bacterium SG7u.111]|nr:gliding motility-associated ABC transporter substrate-binding protein GldG [Flammeovirgaceae bacterium SG7u.132]WPO35667.1 gliding motility-associated ABC transporter substrate-binding protein GldG [Flammeovirgaceae bacterium SG7u.111]
MKIKARKWEDILMLTALALLLVLVNMNLSYFPLRLDLTEEKRYTITDASKRLLGELDDVVYVEVYLEGELNSGLKRLQRSIRETLEEFRVYGGQNIEYKFIDPSDAPNEAARNRFYQQITDKGLPATTLYESVDGQRQQKVIFPGAIISYRNKEAAVLLLKGNKTASPEQQLNQSVEGVEYELISAISKMTLKERKSIAFIEGHKELTANETADITAALSEKYIVDRSLIDPQRLANYDAIIIAQPKTAFSEQEKFVLDQYIMKGGKAIFLMDEVQMNLDSISRGGTYAFGYSLNIEDLLFRYGVRPNIDLIQDLQAGAIEVYTGNVGNRPNIQRLRWPYYVYLNTFSKHPIVRNLDVVYAKFFGTIDTVKTTGIKKTPLIFTSQYTRVKKLPSMVDLNELREDLKQEKYTISQLPVAYMLEGEFKSFYATRFAPKGATGQEIVRESVPTKILVMGDADIIKNEFDKKTGAPLPIDVDKNSGQLLSNKEFMLNALAYMTDEDGIIASRNKQVTLRPLDQFRVKEEKHYWQIINLVLPVAIITIFGFIRFYWRKRKFARNIK